MLLVGSAFAIRSERRLCEEVHLNLAYRWFCRFGLGGEVPDHSIFSKNRHGGFPDSDLDRGPAAWCRGSVLSRIGYGIAAFHLRPVAQCLPAHVGQDKPRVAVLVRDTHRVLDFGSG